jgi:hypothetical protein
MLCTRLCANMNEWTFKEHSICFIFCWVFHVRELKIMCPGSALRGRRWMWMVGPSGSPFQVFSSILQLSLSISIKDGWWAKWLFLLKAASSVIYAVGRGRVNEAGVIPFHRKDYNELQLSGLFSHHVRVKRIKETNVSPWELSQFYNLHFSKAWK